MRDAPIHRPAPRPTGRHCLVLHHDADMDGILSGEIAARALRGQGAYVVQIGWDYGRPVPEWNAYHEVYLLDISVPEILDAADGRLVWIDHHASALERWKNPARPIRGVRVDGVAACRLAWWYFYHRETPVTAEDFLARRVNELPLVTLVGEHDVWDHRDPAAWDLHNALLSLSREELGSLLEDQLNPALSALFARALLDPLLERGRIVGAYQDNERRRIGETAATVFWRGIVWCFLTGHGNSRLFDYAMSEEHEALLLARFDGRQRRWVVSLYPRPDSSSGPDIVAVAQAMGGGGHKGACGFRAEPSWMSEFLAGGEGLRLPPKAR